MLWFKRLRRQDRQQLAATREQLLAGEIPVHVAAIMDGNGRWAKERGLPRIAGHRSGMQTVKRITRAADGLGIKVLTLFAFSTENWKRPQDEVDYLMNLPQEFLALELDELCEKNVQVRMMGWTDHLPEHTLSAIQEAVEKTKHNTGLILNFALNYGSRQEIVQAVKSIADDLEKGRLTKDAINDELFSSYLCSAGLPDPDLLIRTSGELRLSNFMMWQLAYTELFFSPLYWPDFTEKDFYEAISHYQKRSRRFGGL